MCCICHIVPRMVMQIQCDCMAVSVVLISAVVWFVVCCLVHDPKVNDASLCGSHCCWVL